MASRGTTDDTLRIVLVVVAAIALAPLVGMAVTVPMLGAGGGRMTGPMGGGGMGSNPAWWLLAWAVWAAVVLGLGYLGYRWLAGSLGVAPADAGGGRADPRQDPTDPEFEERSEATERE